MLRLDTSRAKINVIRRPSMLPSRPPPPPFAHIDMKSFTACDSAIEALNDLPFPLSHEPRMFGSQPRLKVEYADATKRKARISAGGDEHVSNQAAFTTQPPTAPRLFFEPTPTPAPVPKSENTSPQEQFGSSNQSAKRPDHGRQIVIPPTKHDLRLRLASHPDHTMEPDQICTTHISGQWKVVYRAERGRRFLSSDVKNAIRTLSYSFHIVNSKLSKDWSKITITVRWLDEYARRSVSRPAERGSRIGRSFEEDETDMLASDLETTPAAATPAPPATDGQPDTAETQSNAMPILPTATHSPATTVATPAQSSSMASRPAPALNDESVAQERTTDPPMIARNVETAIMGEGVRIDTIPLPQNCLQGSEEEIEAAQDAFQAATARQAWADGKKVLTLRSALRRHVSMLCSLTGALCRFKGDSLMMRYEVETSRSEPDQVGASDSAPNEEATADIAMDDIKPDIASTQPTVPTPPPRPAKPIEPIRFPAVIEGSVAETKIVEEHVETFLKM